MLPVSGRQRKGRGNKNLIYVTFERDFGNAFEKTIHDSYISQIFDITLITLIIAPRPV